MKSPLPMSYKYFKSGKTAGVYELSGQPSCVYNCVLTKGALVFLRGSELFFTFRSTASAIVS